VDLSELYNAIQTYQGQKGISGKITLDDFKRQIKKDIFTIKDRYNEDYHDKFNSESFKGNEFWRPNIWFENKYSSEIFSDYQQLKNMIWKDFNDKEYRDEMTGQIKHRDNRQVREFVLKSQVDKL
jgi:hypothetical protein